jgi:hypothetical protein
MGDEYFAHVSELEFGTHHLRLHAFPGIEQERGAAHAQGGGGVSAFERGPTRARSEKTHGQSRIALVQVSMNGVLCT